MTDGMDSVVEEPPGVAERELMKAEYRKKNIALDQARERFEEQMATGVYSEEQASEMSARFEEAGREMLAEVQGRLEAHCEVYNLRL